MEDFLLHISHSIRVHLGGSLDACSFGPGKLQPFSNTASCHSYSCYLLFIITIIVVRVHCGIYKSSYNISNLNSALPSFSFAPLALFLE
jgi:hypothetical protein